MYHFKSFTLNLLTVLFAMAFFAGCKKESAFRYPAKPQVTIAAGDERLNNKLIHLVKDTVYVIVSNISIDSSKKLLVDAGTLLKINGGFFIDIKAGATIEAKGNVDDPIVFTENANKGKAGFNQWGGIRIYGNANNNVSNILSYVRIEFAGAQDNSTFKKVALTFTGTGTQTTINNIEVSYSAGNAFEFNSGNCNAANLLCYASTGIDFNIINGYRGNLQNLLAYRHPLYASSLLNLGGMYISGDSTSPNVSNLTVLGAGLLYGVNQQYFLGSPYKRAGLITEGNCKFHLRNSAILGFANAAYYLDSYNSAASLDSGKSEFTYSVINHADTSKAFYLPPGTYSTATSINLKNFYLRPEFHNELSASTGSFNLVAPFNYYDNIPNPLPNSGNPILTGANFSGVFSDPFFKKVNYRGALGADNWLQGWVNFIPLQTDYNN